MADDDIVTRLRGHIAITTRVHYAKDGYPEPVYVHGPSPICQEAADEIERLRAERDETRQKRDEARRERDEADPLLEELWYRRTEAFEMRSKIERLRAERDEARRALCHVDEGWPFPDDWAREKARELGWDCFKEATDER